VGDTQSDELFVGNRFRTKRHPVEASTVRFSVGGPTYKNGSHAMNGEAVSRLGDDNHEMWERFLAFPDMDQDSSAECSEGPWAAVGGGCVFGFVFCFKPPHR